MEERERSEFERFKDFQKKWESTPAGKQLLQQEAERTLAERTTAASQIMAIRAEQAEALPKSLADLDEKERKYKLAKAAMETAALEYQQARVGLSVDGNNYQVAIARLEQTLTESANPAIDEAKNFFLKKLDWLRLPGRTSHNMLGGTRDIYTDKITVRSESNHPAILQAIEYCRNACSFLEN